MKIIINTAHQRFGGAIQVALSFIYECRNFPEHEYHVLLGQGVSEFLKKQDFPNNFFFYDFDFGIISFNIIKNIQATLGPLEKQIKPDVIISTSGPTYFHSKAPQIIGFNLPLYIYPESPFIQNLRWRKRLKLWLKKQVHFYYFKRDGSAYVTQTDDVNQRVRRALGIENVYTITNTHSNFYTENLQYPNRLGEKKEGEIRLLTVSSYYPHKNLEIIPKVLKELRNRGLENIRFILTLKEQDFTRNVKGFPGIINVGPLPPQECPSLYRECDVMFLPTLAECFSASYPEAMVMGKPIITTDLGFSRSICGDAAIYFKPQQASSAADAIEKLLKDSTLYKKLVIRGKKRLKAFDSPEQRTRKYLDLCQRFALERQD
ncbi:MAG: mannosyltransferase [Candidatus Brocadia sp. WS118]|nr:MAG: mannosyltransferase [Candidatus Brocadia sp. WS118]